MITGKETYYQSEGDHIKRELLPQQKRLRNSSAFTRQPNTKLISFLVNPNTKIISFLVNRNTNLLFAVVAEGGQAMVKTAPPLTAHT
jgi:hypothetical protein